VRLALAQPMQIENRFDFPSSRRKLAGSATIEGRMI